MNTLITNVEIQKLLITARGCASYIFDTEGEDYVRYCRDLGINPDDDDVIPTVDHIYSLAYTLDDMCVKIQNKLNQKEN